MPFTFNEAITYIKNNPNLTTQQILDVAHNTLLDIGPAEVKITYSGSITLPQAGRPAGSATSMPAFEYVNKIVEQGGTVTGADGKEYYKVAKVGNTDLGKLLENKDFKDALKNSFAGNDTEKAAQLKWHLDGVEDRIVVDSEGNASVEKVRVNSSSLWDMASEKFILTGNQPIINMVDHFDITKVWGASEVFAILCSDAEYVDGVKVADYIDYYNYTSQTLGHDFAITAIADAMQKESIKNMADNMTYTIGEDGHISHVGVDGDFFKNTDLPSHLIPDNTPNVIQASEGLKNFTPDQLHVTESIAEFARHHPEFFDKLNKLGFYGSIIEGTMVIFDVKDALAAGDTDGAVQTLGEYFAGLAGEVTGGLIGLNYAEVIISAMTTILGKHPVIYAGLALAATFAGGYYGSQASELLYNILVSMTQIFDGISDMLLDAAKEFAKCYISPIVFDLDGDGIELTNVNNGVNFDLDNNGIAEQTGWLGKDDGFLVRDINGNGKIDNQSEMFGTDNTATALQKLIALDTNGNGKVEGTELTALRIWKDLNQDGVTQAGELQTLSAAGETNQNLTPPIAANDNYNVQACRFYAA